MDLDAAIRALRKAEAAVPRADERAERAARKIRAEARARVDKARQELHAAMVKAYERGARQIDLMNATGYSRERTRQILRAGGVEPE